MTGKAIEINNLSKSFGSRTAVCGLSLDVLEGELFSLLGMNGAGKTTTIKILCGLLAPDGGDACLFGDSVVTNSYAAKRHLNISMQETAVAQNLTVLENLEFVARIYGFSKADAALRTAEMMDIFGLSDRAKDRAKKLSGGMQRRLSIAMALITSPSLLFLDEPTLGLDVVARRELWQHIRGLKSKTTIILTTHYLEEAEALSDRVGIMQDGVLKAIGTPQELKDLSGKEKFEEAFIALSGTEQPL